MIVEWCEPRLAAVARPLSIKRPSGYVASLCLVMAACQDKEMEVLARGRCESLLAAQELSGLPDRLRQDPRARIRPKGDARISDGERTTFVRRAYDRLVPDAASVRIEPRDYICKFDKKAGKVITLSTNGHAQEIRDNDDEWAIKQKATPLLPVK